MGHTRQALSQAAPYAEHHSCLLIFFLTLPLAIKLIKYRHPRSMVFVNEMCNTSFPNLSVQVMQSVKCKTEKRNFGQIGLKLRYYPNVHSKAYLSILSIISLSTILDILAI